MTDRTRDIIASDLDNLWHLVTHAIDASRSSGETVTIRITDTRRLRAGLWAECDDSECDNSDDADPVWEYWGRDMDGTEWRVHVRQGCAQ